MSEGGRREEPVTIPLEGRDKGKVFYLREMTATDAEDWAWRALLALSRSGLDVPDEYLQAGWEAVALFGLRGLRALSMDELRPLLADLMGCVQYVPDPIFNAGLRRPLVESDIQELATRLYLRAKVFDLHTNFSKDASLLSWLASRVNGSSRPTPTLEGGLESLSQADSQPSMS